MLLILFSCLSAGKAETLQVALVIDADNEFSQGLRANLKAELEKLATAYDEILLPEELVFRGNADPLEVKKALESALNHKKSDAVVCLGPVSSHLLARQKDLKKPVFAAFIINAAAQDIVPRKNLNYVDLQLDFSACLLSLQEIKVFRNLVFVAEKCWLEEIPQFAENVKSLGDALGINIISAAPAEILNKNFIETHRIEAAILMPLVTKDNTLTGKVIDRLNAGRVMTMNALGTDAVEQGVFAAIFPQPDSSKLARRLALNLQRLFFKENPAEFATEFSLVKRLHLNMKTARQIGIYPTWSQMTDAVLINGEPEDLQRRLSMEQVMEMAVVRNLQILAKQQEISASSQGIERARAGLRPKINTFARQNVIDEDRAETIMTPGKYATQIGAELMQVLYSEPARANIDIQKLMTAARREEERALILDIMRDAALAYLNVLKSKTLQTIQQDNLEVTRANLDIARFREQVGTSGPAEVYRWEIQMASARQAVIDASVMRKKSELALNQLLNSGQEEEFTTANCDIFAQVFLLDQEKVAPYIDNMFGFRVFRDFLVQSTFAGSPELQQMEKTIQAQQRAHLSAKRRYNQPTVAIQGNFTRTLKESGIGEPKPPMPPAFSGFFRYPDKNDWFIGLQVSMPIHEGGDRKAAIKQAQATVNQLELQHQLLMQRLELNTRMTLEDARASYASIGNAFTRSNYADKALGLVQSAYQRGAVNILDLIDAQNASLVSEEASANAMFNFFSDFIRVCRSVGSFKFILEENSHSEWYKRLEDFYRENGSDAVFERRPTAADPVLSEPLTSGTLLFKDD